MFSGIKSKVDELKAAYDREESPNLEEYEPNTVASLLKQYLRDLPENLPLKQDPVWPVLEIQVTTLFSNPTTPFYPPCFPFPHFATFQFLPDHTTPR